MICLAGSGSCAAGSCGGARGWSVRYRLSQAESGPEKCQAIVRLNITEASYGAGGVRFSGFDVPFAVDTGATTTMIPRDFLRWHGRHAFDGASYGVHRITGVSGREIIGQYHWALLSLNPLEPACAPLIFPRVQIFIPNVSGAHRPDLPALLGMNALREVMTTFQQLDVTFRQRPVSAPESA